MSARELIVPIDCPTHVQILGHCLTEANGSILLLTCKVRVQRSMHVASRNIRKGREEGRHSVHVWQAGKGGRRAKRQGHNGMCPTQHASRVGKAGAHTCATAPTLKAECDVDRYPFAALALGGVLHLLWTCLGQGRASGIA